MSKTKTIYRRLDFNIFNQIVLFFFTVEYTFKFILNATFAHNIWRNKNVYKRIVCRDIGRSNADEHIYNIDLNSRNETAQFILLAYIFSKILKQIHAKFDFEWRSFHLKMCCSLYLIAIY